MKAVRSIAIVGRGAVAWLAAATLARVLAPQRVAITVVDSGKGPDPAAGIATLPSLSLLHRALGIGEPEFMRASGATFRLGTQFEGWSGPGSSYFHACGHTGAAMDGIPFHQFWLKQADAPPLADFSLAAVAAKLSRFTFPSADQRSVLSTLDYGYHLDAVRYANFLRQHVRRLGGVEIEGEVAGVVRHSATGFVDEVVLDSGARVTADLFVDCSGQRVLFEDGDYEDWSQWFASDRVLHVRCAASEAPPACTRVIAMPAGWLWSVPLQGETSHGYVYSSRHASDEEASRALLSELGDKAGEPRLHRFRPGRRAHAWTGNVIALGEAAGAIDPLDWVALHLAQSALLRLTVLFPDRDCGPAGRTEFNRLTASEWDRARDFTLLHYAIAGRDDWTFWRESGSAAPPDMLQRKIGLFRSRGYVILYDDETFDTDSWASVFLGQGVRPRRLDPLAQQVDADQNARKLQRIRSLIRQAADSMMPHATMLERTGASARRST